MARWIAAAAFWAFSPTSAAPAAVPLPPAAAVAAAVVSVGADPIGMVNANYASFNIDSSFNRGFFHIDFANANLRAAAASLAPATLRFGGSGNDFLHYEVDGRGCAPNTTDSDSYGCLNTTHWDALFALSADAGIDFLFGVSYDLATACARDLRTPYAWNASDALRMVQYIAGQHQGVWGFELGNEVNNRGSGGHDFCNVTGAEQAAAFHTFYHDVLQVVYNGTAASAMPRVVGPDSGYLDPQPWLTDFLATVSAPPEGAVPLHAVTHHVYTGVTQKDFNSPTRLDEPRATEAAWYTGIIHNATTAAFQPQVWAGENGPHGGGEDGTCGDGSVCGTFASTLYYADELGWRAAHGFVQHQRQDLVGGRYGLVAVAHDSEYLPAAGAVALQPDFWVNYLWKRVMGTTVLNATTSVTATAAATAAAAATEPATEPATAAPTATAASFNGTLRVYAHRGAPPRWSDWHGRPRQQQPPLPRARAQQPCGGGGGSDGPLGFVLVNLDALATRSVDLSTAVSRRQQQQQPSAELSVWTLTATGGRTFAGNTTINGAPAPPAITDGQPVAALAPRLQAAAEAVEVPPLSVTFVAAPALCLD